MQLATLVDHVPHGQGWLHDGYRCLLAVGGEAATYPAPAWIGPSFCRYHQAALGLKVRSALIDGEAVALDRGGQSNFQALQASFKGPKADVVYYAFDLLELDGDDLTAPPQIERKTRCVHSSWQPLAGFK